MANRTPQRLLKSEAARSQSKTAIETGWASWLVQEIRARAEAQFSSASPDNTEALKDARMLYSAAAVVDSIIRDNAK